MQLAAVFMLINSVLDAIGNIPLISLKNRLSQEEGLLVGTSSGVNVFAALHIDNGKNRVANGTA